MKAPFLKAIKLTDNNINTNLFPFNLGFIKNANFELNINNAVVILSGDNGTGKTTLLECIANNCNFNINGGSKDHNISSNNSNKHIHELCNNLSFSWKTRVSDGFFMKADNFINFANFIDEQAEEYGNYVYNYYGGKSLNEQSHGESFLSLFSNRFDKKGIYLLDEPEAALSPEKILSFMVLLKELSDSGKAQFIIATHSPILMSFPYSQFFYLSKEGLEETSYKNTSHYEITKNFINNPELYLKHLF